MIGRLKQNFKHWIEKIELYEILLFRYFIILFVNF